MKIKLTEKYKSKLLEMIYKSFPEYKRIEFEQSGMINLFKTNLTPTKEYDYIHWFEFCTLILSQKLDNFSANDFHDSLFYSHPIDYLYTEFLKLNK